MFDSPLVKDLTEMLGKSLAFKDLEAIGGYVFKDHGFSIHTVAGVDRGVNISLLNAAKTLVQECERTKKIFDLFTFAFELEGVPLNGRLVILEGLENILYRLPRTEVFYDYQKRKIVNLKEDKASLLNWGALRIGMDFGSVRFLEDRGRIVSDVINYAAHLEIQLTKPSALSVSNGIYTSLSASMKAVFTDKQEFEGRTAWSTSVAS